MSTAPQNDTSPPPASPRAAPWRVLRADDDLRLLAAQRLVERNAKGDTMVAAKRFLAVAQAHRIDLKNMWASVAPDGARVRHVCLATAGAGRTLMLFTSSPADEDDAKELSSVIDHACANTDGAALAQALLEPGDDLILSAMLSAGFSRIADLAYLKRPNAPRPPRAPAPPELPEGVRLHRWRKGDDHRLLQALDRTYEDTLDCPQLCALRDTRDVLDSHRATGVFDAAYWWIITENDRPEGAMLFNPCPAQQHVELVYLGLSPRLRGRAIAAPLLDFALASIAHKRREPTVTCAVDTANAPALRLYDRAGFEPFGRRIALVRKIG